MAVAVGEDVGEAADQLVGGLQGGAAGQDALQAQGLGFCQVLGSSGQPAGRFTESAPEPFQMTVDTERAITSGMTWRQRVRREPARSRLLLVAGVLLSTVGATGLIWASQSGSTRWFFGVTGAWFGLVLAILLAVFVASIRALRPIVRLSRPMRFTLAHNRFVINPFLSPGLVALPQVALCGVFVAVLVSASRRAGAADPATAPVDTGFMWVMAALVAALVLLMAAMVVFTWRGLATELTPAGVRWHGPFFRRLVPWEAFAPGGPPRPHVSANQLHLVVARPELVVQRGWGLGFGPRQRPSMALGVDVHPWFLADTIRWYVGHPEDRGAIGTPAERDRLIAELAASASADQPPATAPPPRPVTVAAWLTCAAVAIGVLAATADLIVAVVFDDQIMAAAERAVSAEEERITGQPEVDAAAGVATFAKGWAIGILVLAIVLGTVAVVLAGEIRRGSGHARIGLLVLSGLVIGWSACPCGPPTLSLTDPGTHVLGGTVLALWVLQRTAIFALTVAVLVLLLLPAANAYFRPAAIK